MVGLGGVPSEVVGLVVWFPGGSVFTFVQLRCVIEFNVLLVRIFRLSVFFDLSHVS